MKNEKRYFVDVTYSFGGHGRWYIDEDDNDVDDCDLFTLEDAEGIYDKALASRDELAVISLCELADMPNGISISRLIRWSNGEKPREEEEE